MKRNNTFHVPNVSVIWSLILLVYLILAHEFRRDLSLKIFFFQCFHIPRFRCFHCHLLYLLLSTVFDYCMHDLLMLFDCRLLVTRFEQSISGGHIVRHERFKRTSRALANRGSSNLSIRWLFFFFFSKSNPRPVVLFCVQSARLIE